jgi:biotin operon repressor
MLQQLIDRSPDLKQLRDEGFEIEVKGGYLLIHHIPYVNQSREINYGVS